MEEEVKVKSKFAPKTNAHRRKRIEPETGTTQSEAKFAETFVELLGKGVKREVALSQANDASYAPTKANRTTYIYQVVGRDRVQKYISELLTKAGMGHEAVLNDLRRAITLGLASGEAKVSDAIKGLDIALRMHNMFPAQKVESTSVRFNADLMNKSHRDLGNDLNALKRQEEELLEEGELVMNGKKLSESDD